MSRNRFTKNEIVFSDTYAEIFLYNINQDVIAKTKIDLEDAEKCKEHKWYLKQSAKGKVYVQKRMGRIHLSHFVTGFVKEKGMVVDHINGDTLDNRKENLRIVTHQQNMMNQRVLPSNNTSGVIGVGWNKENSCWDAQIKYNQIMYHLGSYKNKEDAIKARLNGELKYFGEHKIINFEKGK